MFGAEKFASTRRTFLSKCFDREIAVSRARVVFPTPPLMDTKLRMFVILSPNIDNDCQYLRVWGLYFSVKFMKKFVFVVAYIFYCYRSFIPPWVFFPRIPFFYPIFCDIDCLSFIDMIEFIF